MLKRLFLCAFVSALALPAVGATLKLTNQTPKAVEFTVIPEEPSGSTQRRTVGANQTWDTGLTSSMETVHQIEARPPGQALVLACADVMNAGTIFLKLMEDPNLYWYTCLPAANVEGDIGCGILDCMRQAAAARERKPKD